MDSKEPRRNSASSFQRKSEQIYAFRGADVLERVLVSIEADNRFYEKSGAIIHSDGLEKSIDFHPYPCPSYIEELVKSLKDTLVQANNAFLQMLGFKVIMRFLKHLTRLLRPKTLSISNLSNML